MRAFMKMAKDLREKDEAAFFDKLGKPQTTYRVGDSIFGCWAKQNGVYTAQMAQSSGWVYSSLTFTDTDKVKAMHDATTKV